MPRSDIPRIQRYDIAIPICRGLEYTEYLHKMKKMQGNRSTYIQQKEQIIGYMRVRV